MRNPLSHLSHILFYSFPAISAAASILLVTACGLSEKPAIESEENNEAAIGPIGFTDFSGVLVASLGSGSFEEGGRLQEIVLSIHDPGQDVELSRLSAGEIATHGPSGHGSLKFSADFSHLAYKEDQTSESAILVYRLEGQEEEAELIHRIEPPSSDITGGYSYKTLAFQPDGKRLWYSIDDGDDESDDEVRSIGMTAEEEPRDEGILESPGWIPDNEGELIEILKGTEETEVEGGTVEVEFHTDGRTIDPQKVDFTVTGTLGSPQMSYNEIRPLGEGEEFLVGGKRLNHRAQDDDHGWGPLMRLTLSETGEVDTHEVVVPETEKQGVDGLQVSPGDDAAVIAVTNRNAGNTYAEDTNFYFVDLTDPADPRRLDGLVPKMTSDDFENPTVELMGWLT